MVYLKDLKAFRNDSKICGTSSHLLFEKCDNELHDVLDTK